MADPHVVSGLKAKQADLERKLALYEDAAKEARIALSHVNATLRLFQLEDAAVNVPVHLDVSRWFKRGDLWKLCKAALEASPGAMSLRTRCCGRRDGT
jgi:hypothetical protein